MAPTVQVYSEEFSIAILGLCKGGLIYGVYVVGYVCTDLVLNVILV